MSQKDFDRNERFQQGEAIRREVLLQAALYCGMPVGLECFRIAKNVLDAHGA